MATKDIYYVPEGSKWPIFGSFALFVLFIGGALLFNGNANDHTV